MNHVKEVLGLMPVVNRAIVRQLVQFWALVLEYEHINRMNITVRSLASGERASS